MIILEKDWTFTVSKRDAALGYIGENAVQILQVKLLGTEYAAWDMVFDVMQGEMYNIWPVDKTITEGNLLLSVLIKREYICFPDRPDRAGPVCKVFHRRKSVGNLKEPGRDKKPGKSGNN